MMILIDRGQVMIDYLENIKGKNSYKAKYEALCKAVDDAPAVDAAPVVHARWELHGNDDDCGSSYFCTNCGSGYDEELFYNHEHYAPYLFCPHCGAKMDAKEEGERVRGTD